MTALPPDPDGLNNDRAAWAAEAISAFTAGTRTDRPDALCDLLADLHHWADRNGLDFHAELARGERHYRDETTAPQEMDR